MSARWGGGRQSRRHTDRDELLQAAYFLWLCVLVLLTGLVYGVGS